MLKFPFYQMEVAHFHQLLKSLQNKPYTTEAELMEILDDIDALKDTWPRISLLLQAKVFQYDAENGGHYLTSGNKDSSMSQSS